MQGQTATILQWKGVRNEDQKKCEAKKPVLTNKPSRIVEYSKQRGWLILNSWCCLCTYEYTYGWCDVLVVAVVADYGAGGGA